jgi:hypothetical protein
VNITIEDFKDWKANHVTKAVTAGLQARVDETQDRLGESAGIDPLQDRYLVGYIAGIRDFINANMEDMAND